MIPVVQVATARPRFVPDSSGGGGCSGSVLPSSAKRAKRCGTNPSADIVLRDFGESCHEAGVAADPCQATVSVCGWLEEVLAALAAFSSRERSPNNAHDTDFQVTRGTTGCSN